jgi:hypothetical protein
VSFGLLLDFFGKKVNEIAVWATRVGRVAAKTTSNKPNFVN